MHQHFYSRRELHHHLASAAAQSNYYAPLTLLILQIDNFADFCRLLSPIAQDRLLDETEKVIGRLAPHQAFCARWSGRKFALLINDYTAEQAGNIAADIAKELLISRFDGYLGTLAIKPKISCGTATYPQTPLFELGPQAESNIGKSVHTWRQIAL